MSWQVFNVKPFNLKLYTFYGISEHIRTKSNLSYTVNYV